MEGTNLKPFVENLKGANIIHVTYRTNVVLAGGKKNEQQGRVEKVTTTPAMLFSQANVFAYQDMVRRRQAKEGKDPIFIAKDPAWEWKTINNGVVEYTNKENVTERYLKIIKTGRQRTQYFLDGIPVPVSQIIGLRESKSNEYQGVDQGIEVRVVKLSNLVRVSIKGNKLEGADFFYA